MEALVKKYQQKYRKVKEHMNQWDVFQSILVSHFKSASCIVERLQLINLSSNYGTLKCVRGIRDALCYKQIEFLNLILSSMRNTLGEFGQIVSSMEKIYNDGKQLVRGGSNKLSKKQLKQPIGCRPCLDYYLDGLIFLHNVHRLEYLLKISIVSALSELCCKPCSSDLVFLQQLLIDQPNILSDEVQMVFDVVFAEEIQ